MPNITSRRYGSKYSTKKSRCDAAQYIKDKDNFGKGVPNFNLGG